MHIKKPIVISGTEYPSVAAAAKELGISRERLKYQIKNGRIDRCSNFQEAMLGNGRSICYRGIRYPTIKEFAKHFNLSYQAAKKQFERGKTADEIIDSHNKRIVKKEVKKRGGKAG